jgi:hypothetical protein
MGNTFKLSSSFPSSLILSTSKLKSLIKEVKQDELDMDTTGLETLLNLNRDEATSTILRFAKRKDRPIVSKYHLLSGLIIVSQGSVEEKIACIFKLFDMSDLNEYTHDEFGVAVMVSLSFSFSLHKGKLIRTQQASLASAANLCDLLLDTGKIQAHNDELKDCNKIDMNVFQKWCMKELNNESEILRRVEHVEKLPLPVATDPTLPVSDPQAQEFLDKLPDLTSPDFSLEQMRRLIAEGRALAAAMCPHNKL